MRLGKLTPFSPSMLSIKFAAGLRVIYTSLTTVGQDKILLLTGQCY
jgi:hypothetical protein